MQVTLVSHDLVFGSEVKSGNLPTESTRDSGETEPTMNTEKEFTVDGQSINFRNSSGAGLKECLACKAAGTDYRFVAARTAKKLGKCHCGAEFLFETKEKKEKAKNRFSALTEADFTLILTLAGNVSNGGNLEKPTVSRPKDSDFASAARANDSAKLNQLTKDYDEWAVFDASKELTKGAKDKLTSAASNYYGDEE